MNYKTHFIGKYKIEGVENYTTLDKAVKYLEDKKIIGLDIETSRKFEKGVYDESVYKGGLDPYLTNICMLQIGDLKNIFVIDVRDFTKEELKPLLELLNYQEKRLIVAHNAKFESKHIKHNYGINFKHIWDTMIVEMTLTNGLGVRYGLADLAEKYLDVKKKKENLLFSEMYDNKVVTLDQEYLEKYEDALTPFEVEDNYEIDKSTRLEFVNLGDKPFTAKQVLYGGDDVIMPILIRQRQVLGRQVSHGEVYNPKNWQRLENKFVMVLADMELNGMYVNQQMWRDLHDENEVIYLKREKILNNYIIENHPEYVSNNYDMFSGDLTCKIQWSSSKQVINLFRKLDICPRAYSNQTKRVEDTVGATELLKTLPNNLKISYERNKDEEIVDLHSFKLAYLLYKKAEQAITTFGKQWLKYIHPITGRAHSNYRQILNTTRISSTSPNLNNISNGKWRDCFEVPDGKLMVNADYSSQEVRVLANTCEDDSFIDFFVKGNEIFGDDFHSFTATKVYRIMENNPELLVPKKELENGDNNPDFTKDDGERRSNSKKVTFGIAFGKSAYGFSQDLGIDIHEAEKLINSYLDAFPGLRAHFTKCEEKAESQDYVLINPKLDVRWFCTFFDEIKINQDAFFEGFFDEDLMEELFGTRDYKQISKENRVDYKKELYLRNPNLKGLISTSGRLRGSLVRRNKNYPIQGSAAMCMKIAMVTLREEMINHSLNYMIIGNIYDEVLLEVDKEDGKKAGEVLKKNMEKAGKYITPLVPQIANYVLSKIWEH